MAKGTLATIHTMDLHLKQLQLNSKESYFKWCARNGFRCTLEKTLKDLSKETKFVKDLQATNILASSNRSKKGLPYYLNQIHNGCPIDISYLRVIEEAYKKLPCRDKKFLIDFLLLVHKKSKLLDDHKDYAVILKVFSYRDWFIREWSEWDPKSHNRDKQFSSLVRHLFTQYDIPKFMDTAWKSNSHDDKEIDWFFEMGNGTNIRKCKGLPFTITKKTAHNFLQAPNTCNVTEAFRWARVITFGGCDRLHKA